MSNMIAALLAEREGYARRGKMDRVAEVDAQLRELGFEHKQMQRPIEAAAVEPAIERSVRKKAAKKRGI